ncbi:MAG: anti-sigma factor family protein, partial [Gemmatimonadales bacterium]
MKNIERPHIPDEELHAYCDGELSPTQRMEIAEHLLGCLICRAQHDDVESLRARTTALLELASPPAIRRRVASPAPVPARRRDAPRIAAAIAAAVVGTGVWFSLRPDRVVNPDSQLATSLLTPSLGVALPDANPAGQRARQITISNRVTGVPGVLALHHAPVASFPRSVAAAAVDPVLGDDWPESALDSIVRLAVARIEGLTVTSIRTHRSDGSTGARPTSLVREQLPDGRSIW